jgi:tetratricopeptide (TPR) repeat protein
MCLANILRTVGEIAEAYELAAETLRLYPDIYGREHPYHYGCMGNLAILERIRDNNVERARQLNETALEGLENKLERDHHYSLTVAVNLATDLAALGDLKSAINLGRGTLRRLGVVLGEDHPATLACAANLSADLQKDGFEEEAAELFERTLDGYDRLMMGPDHPDIEAAMARRHLDLDFDPPPI